MKIYKAQIDNDLEFDITDNDIDKLDIISIEKSKLHILKDRISYPAEITATNFMNKNYIVKVNSNMYKVSISNELDIQIKAMGFALGSSKQVNYIKAPMPGLIIDRKVEIGQTVQEGDYLLVLEAMKMENIITSPRDGIIKSITASIGDAVDKGKLLIEFE